MPTNHTCEICKKPTDIFLISVPGKVGYYCGIHARELWGGHFRELIKNRQIKIQRENKEANNE